MFYYGIVGEDFEVKVGDNIPEETIQHDVAWIMQDSDSTVEFFHPELLCIDPSVQNPLEMFSEIYFEESNRASKEGQAGEFLILAQVSETEAPLILKVPLSDNSQKILLKDKNGTYFQVSASLLCSAMLGISVQAWSVQGSDWKFQEDCLEYMISCNTQGISSFIVLRCEKGIVTFDVADLRVKEVSLKSCYDSSIIEVDAHDILTRLDSVVVTGGTINVATKEILTEQGDMGVASITVAYPIASPNNANSYNINIRTLQPMLVNGEETHELSFTVIGDWEFSDILQALGNLKTKVKGA